MDRETGQVTVLGIMKSPTLLSTHARTCYKERNRYCVILLIGVLSQISKISNIEYLMSGLYSNVPNSVKGVFYAFSIQKVLFITL